MKLLGPNELELSPEGPVFRQSRLAGTIRGVGLCAVFLAAGPVWRLVGAPWFIWAPCLAVGVGVALLLPRSVIALYRKSNWVLALHGNAVWINLRSPFNHHLPAGQTVVRLETSEIESVSIYAEQYSTPNSEGGATSWAMESLRLKLTHTDTQGLADALEQERLRQPVPGRFGGSGLTLHYPVSVPEPGMILVAWRGATMTDHVTPRASRAAELLAAKGVRVGEPTLLRRRDWAQLQGAELDSCVKELALAGKAMEAVELLRLRRGLGLSEAKRRVEELTAPR
ncbi:MAG TPA: hypothetical protein VNZ22_02305 [Bacillota bacterium]|nr:hypothetical protein [Bacillota bacterium]